MNAHPNKTTTLIEKAIAFAGSEAKLGAMTGYSQNAIWSAKRNGRISPELADAIQKATGGTVSRQELRPDIFGDDDQPATTGPLIRSARKARNMGQADVADALGVTVQAVSQWERNETMPSGLNLLKLSGILGIDLPHGVTLPPMADFSNLSQLRESIEEVVDLLHALDKIGDGIGGADGFSVSAVALAAKSVADNALDAVRAMGEKA